MNRIGRRILSQVLAFTLAIGLPFQGTAAFAAGTNAAADSYAAEANAATPATPAKPTLPAGFTEALEKNNGLDLKSGIGTTQTKDGNIILNVTAGWNNKNEGHAEIKNTNVFKSKAFTILFNAKLDVTTDGTNNETQKCAAFSVGTSANNLHLLTYSGKLGYGDTEAGGGISANSVDLSGIDKDSWNAVAMTYEEKDTSNGHVIVYINGEKAGEVPDVGFKLSEANDLKAMIARSFNTSFMQNGSYYNIVTGNTVLNEETAIAETAYRKYAAEHLPANTAALENYIKEAEKLIGTEFASAGLADALAAAKALLATNPDTPRQPEVDAAASKLLSEISKSNPETILIKGSDIDNAAKNMNGLTYKGFGMLNGNSTSNLLLEYKDKAPDKYNEMMQYLFDGDYPLFTHIKMEMGNDGNNSTGAEACTMRYEDEEADASRSPGFVMAADAKKINPAVKISILRWGMPKWVADKWNGEDQKGAGYEAVYKWYKETIFDAYEKYDYVVDFVNPDVNETGNPNDDFIKWYSNRIKGETEFPDYMDEQAQNAYKSIRIIASDENKSLNIVPHMRADEDLYNAVDIIGFHYRTNATDDYVTMADVDDKEVWYSEGCATFGYSELQENKTAEYGANSIGGYQSPLALMDSFITAFDSSRRTHYMFQPAIGAFYEGIQYGHKELLSARDPWSGYIHYDPALYMLEHFAKFAKTGWEDSNPDTNDIWRAISAATDPAFAGTDNEHATAGIDGKAGYMTLAAPDKSDFSVVFVNNTRNEKAFYIKTEGMDTAAAKDLHYWVTETDKYLQDKGTIAKHNDGWIVTLPAYSVATATTLNTTPERTPEEGIHNEDRAVLDTDETGGTLDATDDVLYADNFEYAEEADDFLAKRGNEPRYMLDTHGAWIVENGKLKHELANSVSQWNGGDPSTIVGDFRWMDTITSVDAELPGADAWTRLTVRAQTGMNWNNSGYTVCVNGSGKWELYRIGTKVADGSVTASKDRKYNLKIIALKDTISVAINDESVATYKDTVPMLSGRVKLSSSWAQVYFDNLLIKTVSGGIPYAVSMVDGQDDCVKYTGNWVINNPGSGSADNWYRTISSTSTADAAFTFPINGSGFAIIGGNNGSAVLEVSVDDQVVDAAASTLASPTRGETYVLSDLENGAHNIKIVVKSGTLNIDAIHTLGSRIDVSEEDDFLISADTSTLPSIPAVISGGTIADLPTEVDVLTALGNIVKKTVVWDLSEDAFTGKEFSTAFITGTVQDGTNALGLPLTVSLPVGMVVPADTFYFIDSVESDPSKVDTTEPYETVKSLLGNKLLNDKYDQLKTNDTAWGLVDTDTGTKGYDATTDHTATGLYGAKNETGETLSYAFTLPAGNYKVISAHREWWNMNRPMKAELSFGGKTINAGTISLNGSSGDLINKKVFTLESEQLVTYTLTATGTQAPVISWLAVVKASDEELKPNTYTVTFKNDDNIETVTVTEGEKVAEPPAPTKDGYTFDGWYADNASTAFDFNTVITSDITLTAKWTPISGTEAKEELSATITYAETQIKDLKQEDYTAEAWSELTEALEEAKLLLEDENANTEDVNAANTRLQNAITALPVAKARKALNDAITAAGSLQQSSYTTDSWKEFQTKLDAAKTAAAKPNATESELTTALSALKTAQNALKPAGSQHTHTYTYKDNGNGTHTATCKDNDDTKTEPHTYVNDTCTLCGSKKTGGSANQTVSVSKVTLNSTRLTLGVKETFKLTAKVTPANATDKKVTWKSSNTKVATVKNGKITAKRKGSAKITATAGGKSVTCKVTVKTAPRKITVTPKTKSLKKGKTFTIKVKLPKNTASNKITFTSKNKRVATVSAKGKVKGVKKGKTTITIKTFNNKKATVKVTVR
ncbi:MAG: hypothetical protein HFJ04_02770 [Lachnospiraceae bacterium]|nr:hypothetical protein [Lachnospiraceae bacterium]